MYLTSRFQYPPNCGAQISTMAKAATPAFLVLQIHPGLHLARTGCIRKVPGKRMHLEPERGDDQAINTFPGTPLLFASGLVF
jgi:hypothetical protein